MSDVKNASCFITIMDINVKTISERALKRSENVFQEDISFPLVSSRGTGTCLLFNKNVEKKGGVSPSFLQKAGVSGALINTVVVNDRGIKKTFAVKTIEKKKIGGTFIATGASTLLTSYIKIYGREYHGISGDENYNINKNLIMSRDDFVELVMRTCGVVIKNERERSAYRKFIRDYFPFYNGTQSFSQLKLGGGLILPSVSYVQKEMCNKTGSLFFKYTVWVTPDKHKIRDIITKSLEKIREPTRINLQTAIIQFMELNNKSLIYRGSSNSSYYEKYQSYLRNPTPNAEHEILETEVNSATNLFLVPITNPQVKSVQSVLCQTDTSSESVIAVMLSYCEEAGNSINFIKTYDYEECTPIPRHSKTFPSYIIKSVDQPVSWEQNHNPAVLASTSFPKSNKHTFKQVDVTSTKHILMEKIDGDVSGIFRNKTSIPVTVEQIETCLIQILFAIEQMRYEYRIQHNDLHTGNVFFEKMNGKHVFSKNADDIEYLRYDIVTKDDTKSIYIPFYNKIIYKIADYGFAVKYGEPVLLPPKFSLGDNSWLTINLPRWEEPLYDMATFLYSSIYSLCSYKHAEAFVKSFAMSLLENLLKKLNEKNNFDVETAISQLKRHPEYYQYDMLYGKHSFRGCVLPWSFKKTNSFLMDFRPNLNFFTSGHVEDLGFHNIVREYIPKKYFEAPADLSKVVRAGIIDYTKHVTSIEKYECMRGTAEAFDMNIDTVRDILMGAGL